MRHSTPCSTLMAISYPKLVKILQKSQISDNLTDKIDSWATVPTQSHRVLGDLVSLMLVCLQMYA